MAGKNLKVELQFLSDDNNFPDASGKRERGRRFEKLIYSLLEEEKLSPNSSFRPEGEEIDGSFVFGQSVFLFEAKWHQAPMPASSIYQFKGKVDGKLIGTIGIYISMSGFSSEAVDALTYGKSINIILFDKDDFTVCVEQTNGFRNVLLTKVRKAAEKGTAFFPMTSLSVSSSSTAGGPQVQISQSLDTSFTDNDPVIKTKYDLVFIVEGPSDQRVIAGLAERIFKMTGKRKEINIVVAMGKYSVAIIANSLQSLIVESQTQLVLVVDSDYDKEETLAMMQKNLSLTNKDAIIITPDPAMEAWLTDKNSIKNSTELKDLARRNKKEINEFIKELVEKINIEKLKRQDESFKKLFNILAK